MTDEERIADLEARVQLHHSVLERQDYQLALLAWLHNELVHELRTLIESQMGQQMRDPAVIARAKRLAALRKATMR